MREEKKDKMLNELGERAEAVIYQNCKKDDLPYPLSSLFEKLEALLDRLSLEQALAEWCLQKKKSFEDFKKLSSEIGF